MATPRLLVRLILVPTGIGLGSLVAALVLLGGLVARHGLAAMGDAVLGFALAIFGYGMEGSDGDALAQGAVAVWLMMCLLLAAPMAVVALFGEALGLSRPVSWIALTGIAYAAVPAIFEAGGEAVIGFAASGLCAGLSYWIVAGRGAGRAATPT